MHETMIRLYQAAKELKSVEGQSALARLLETSPQTVKNWESRGISSQGILKAADVVGVSAVWLETGKGAMRETYKLPETEIPPAASQDSIILYQWDIAAKASDSGSGIVNDAYPDLIRSIEIPASAIWTLFGRNDLTGIEILNVPTDSMAPTIPKHSLVFMDTRVQEFQGDGVYVFELDGETFIKRLQRVPKKFLAKSDNPLYDNFEIVPDEFTAFRIIGRFVNVLPLEIIKL